MFKKNETESDQWMPTPGSNVNVVLSSYEYKNRETNKDRLLLRVDMQLWSKALA